MFIQVSDDTLAKLQNWATPVMESRPHHRRARRDHTIRDETTPSETETTPSETETFKIRDRDSIFFYTKNIIFSLGIFVYTKKIIYFTGDLPPIECFFHASLLILFFFRSCGLDRAVSSETETFEPRDQDATETFDRRDRDP